VNELGNSLIAVLNEQIDCAQAMLAALARENKALVDGDGGLLDTASADKARLVESLEALERRRHQLSEAIESRVRPADGQTELPSPTGPEWQSLLALIAECKTRNQRNGALVKARSEQVQIALQALRGSEPGFYDPSGLKPSARSARPLGTA
jgi:flagellar biosynthesis/type III secretory pathway chaperone